MAETEALYPLEKSRDIVKTFVIVNVRIRLLVTGSREGRRGAKVWMQAPRQATRQEHSPCPAESRGLQGGNRAELLGAARLSVCSVPLSPLPRPSTTS